MNAAGDAVVAMTSFPALDGWGIDVHRRMFVYPSGGTTVLDEEQSIVATLTCAAMPQH